MRREYIQDGFRIMSCGRIDATARSVIIDAGVE